MVWVWVIVWVVHQVVGGYGGYRSCWDVGCSGAEGVGGEGFAADGYCGGGLVGEQVGGGGEKGMLMGVVCDWEEGWEESRE